MGKRRGVHTLGESIRWHWVLLGNRSSLSWPVTVVFLPFGLLGPVLIDRTRLGGSELHWLVAGLVGQLALMACINVAARAIHGKSATGTRPLATVVAIVLAIAIRGLAIEWLAVAMGLSTAMDYSYRVGSSLPTMAGGYIVMALVVGSYHRHRRLAAMLTEKRIELDESNHLVRGQLHDLQNEVVAQVRQLIDPFLDAIDELVKRVEHGSSTKSIAHALRGIADDELRPLSHRLLTTASAVPVPDRKEPYGELAALPLPSHLPLATLIRPAAGLIITILSFSQAMRLAAEPAFLLLPILSGLIPMLVFAAARVVVGRWTPRLWIGIAVAGVVGALGVVLSVQVEIAIGLPVPPYVVDIAALAGALLGLLAATYVAVGHRRSATEEELQGYVDALRAGSSLLSQHLFIARRNLSYVIHGSLQGALYAASMRLLANPVPSPELISAIRHDVALAARKLDASEMTAVRLNDALPELARMWSGECEITWKISEGADLLMSTAPIAETSVAEIARECITNSVRHGRARAVQVGVVVKDRHIRLTCSDDGGGVVTTAGPGLGSRMLDELCIQWVRTREGMHTRVTADIAVAL